MINGAFVFAFAKGRFSYDAAHFIFLKSLSKYMINGMKRPRGNYSVQFKGA